MKGKRVIFFVLPTLNGGGAEKVIRTLCESIDKNNFSPVIVLLNGNNNCVQLNDVEVVGLGASKARYSVFKLFYLIRRRKPDVVLSTIGHVNLIVGLLKFFFPRHTKIIARESNTVSEILKTLSFSWVYKFLYKLIYPKFDGVICQSDYMRLDLIRHYNVPINKMVVINNPVKNHNTERAAPHYYFDNQSVTVPFNLIVIGRLTYQKGLDRLLSIAEKLSDDFIINIYGEGELEQELRLMISALNLQSRVFLRGYISELTEIIQNSDALLLTSRFEGLPNVVLEAHASGVPVIAFDSPGGTSELVIDGVNGFLISDDDIDGFSNVIKSKEYINLDSKKIIALNEKYSVENIVKIYEGYLNFICQH